MITVRNHVEVDVGKQWLDVCYNDGKKEHVKNIKSCRSKLIRNAKKIDAIVSFEATGPYEDALAEECLASGVKAVRLDSWGARKYAESQGLLEKTDAIDCEMIRDYAASLKESKLRFVKRRTEAQKTLKKAICVRKNLMKAKAIVFNQLEHVCDAGIKRKISGIIAKFDKEIERFEAECDAAIARDERMKSLAERFQLVKGVGPCTARAVLAYCPCIGEFTSGGIAKLCGLAPLDNKSCTIQKRSRPRRGRQDLKQAMHMAAVSACRSNHILRKKYERLVAAGKPRMVAITAVARHLAILLNNIAKYPDFVPEQSPRDVDKTAAAR